MSRLARKRNQQIMTEISCQESNLNNLRQLVWHGADESTRAIVWKLILGYLPASMNKRELELEHKRKEYLNYTKTLYDSRPKEDINAYLCVFLSKTPVVPLIKTLAFQETLNRLMFILSIEHGQSRFYQAIYEICSIFLIVFASPYCGASILTELVEAPRQIKEIEADCYWCVSILLNYLKNFDFFSGNGVPRLLQEMIYKINPDLSQHFQKERLRLRDFSDRWLTYMFYHELPLALVIRLWDGILSFAGGIAEFGVYIAATLIFRWKDVIKKQKRKNIMRFLHSLPTKYWKEREIEELLAEAFLYFSWFGKS